jgi:plastocyanin
MRTNRVVAGATLVPAAAALSWLTLGGAVWSAAAESKPACTPAGPALSIAAKEKQFDKDCLAAPAGAAFTIEFDNQDAAVPHNVSIYDTAQGDKPLFKGQVIFGPGRVTYSVPAQPAGTYQFRCDPHDDTMIGTFIVGDGQSTSPTTTDPPSTTTTTGPLGLPKI